MTTTYAILNAINNSAKVAHHDGKTAKAIASFSSRDGITVSASKKKLEELNKQGITEEAYRAYAGTIRALYFDTVHIVNAKALSDKAQRLVTEKKARDFFYIDLKALIASMMDATYNVNDLFADGQAVRDFEEQAVAILRKFTAGEDGYDVEAAKIAAFTKWLEPAIATMASGVSMLSFAERDRHANLRKWSAKATKLEASVKAKTEEVAKAEAHLKDVQAKVESGKGSQKAIDNAEKALANIKAELSTIESSLKAAQAKKEEYTNLPTEYTPDEMLSVEPVATVA